MTKLSKRTAILCLAAITGGACSSGGGSSKGTGGTGGAGGTGGTAGSAGTGGAGGTGGTAGSAGTGGAGGTGGTAGSAGTGDAGARDGSAGAAGRDAANPPDAPAARDAASTADAPRIASPVTLAMLPQVFANLVCSRYFGCCNEDERACGILPDDPAMCPEAGLAEGMEFVDQVMKSVAAKRSTYDGAAMAACLQKFAAATCVDARKVRPIAPTFCKATTPLVPKGGPCANTFECIAGFCDGVVIGKDGTCAALKADGADCLLDEECRSGGCDEVDATCGPPLVGLCDP